MKRLLWVPFLLNGLMLEAQESTPFIRLVQPFRVSNTVSTQRQFIIGSTCKDCVLTINGKAVKVYRTGAFALELQLQPGDTSFMIRSEGREKVVSKKISYQYTPPAAPQPVTTFSIDWVETYPAGDLLLQPGDVVKLKVKALPGCRITTAQGLILQEQPLANGNTMPGIYQGHYTVQEEDTSLPGKFRIILADSSGRTVSRESKFRVALQLPDTPVVALTKGRLAHLEYGLGDDRLGGAKIGYLDSNVVLQITGKAGSDYRVQLTPARTAWIPDDLVEITSRGKFTPASLTDKISVSGDSLFDYVKIGLFARLPYQSFQQLDPSRIIVDIFGATGNTNWITHLQTAKEVKRVEYEQIADAQFRVIIYLNHSQHWGHQLYYSGNNLIVKMRRQPEKLELNQLVIALDAGHGGTNTGAVGATGVYEKEITLALSMKLKKALEKEGAKVIMTRESETFFDNKERILFYRDSLPDLLLSIHLNSSEDPFRVGGTSCYYRYPGFSTLSGAIYRRLLRMGLKDYGHTGSFNFMLNSPTEYPNALVETLFLSNLEEEALILDPGFQQRMAAEIVAGLKDFLAGCGD